MPRTHALQDRAGPAAVLNLRLPDVERARLQRLARRQPGLSVSDVVRRAITRELSLAAGRSPFHDVYGRVFADLADVGVHPVVVGAWAAGAHGVVVPIDLFEVVVAAAEVPALRSFLLARGASDDVALDCGGQEFGRRPWALRVLSSWNGSVAEQMATTPVTFDGTTLAVVSAESVLAAGDLVAEPTGDALQAIVDGTSVLDDGERGVVAWDAIGRLTASAAYADVLSRPPHRFVDFRLSRRP